MIRRRVRRSLKSRAQGAAAALPVSRRPPLAAAEQAAGAARSAALPQANVPNHRQTGCQLTASCRYFHTYVEEAGACIALIDGCVSHERTQCASCGARGAGAGPTLRCFAFARLLKPIQVDAVARGIALNCSSQPVLCDCRAAAIKHTVALQGSVISQDTFLKLCRVLILLITLFASPASAQEREGIGLNR